VLRFLSFRDRRSWRLLAIPAIALAVVIQMLIGGTSQATATSAQGLSAGQVAPNPVNLLDCNGWSAKYASLSGSLGGLCTDPIAVKGGKTSRFIDNHWYVGHDEPSVKFISYQPGSGNTMAYFMTMPKDPALAPTASGSVTDYAELSVAPWFGLPICDQRSFPQNPCKPDSDANIGSASPQAAGSALMELQFYPPGFGSFVDGTSCSKTQWCAALTIDSLECNAKTCNPSCTEPVNFAYLQTDGLPAGPPSPQLADITTLLGNARTLKINQGDTVQVSISDPSAGLTTVVRDLTTHQTGYMVASAANGFMDTSMSNCAGNPHSFHAEYSTAAPQNQVPWTALQAGVLMEEEIGHSEACNSVTYKEGFSAADATGGSFADPNVYQTCVGGSEGPRATGEGPCLTNAKGVISCKNAKTQGPTACPTGNPLTGALCEFSDGYCFPKGARTVLIDGVKTTVTEPVANCTQNQYENGDLDFDGTPYQETAWPNGSGAHPTPIAVSGPYTASWKPYPSVQFETDIGGSSALCDTSTGAGCFAPPIGADFYPFYTLSPTKQSAMASLGRGNQGSCAWSFGTVVPGVTSSSLGGDGQYGSPDVAYYGGTLISPVSVNPQTAYECTPGYARPRA
jgi:hypothetical protein